MESVYWSDRLDFTPSSAAAIQRAMLPDPLQFVHSRFPHAPLHTLQQLHVWIHTDRRLRAPLGIASQLIFVVAVVIGAAWLHHGAVG